MSEKILTISVAAYNMEKYLDQCLSSLAISEIADDLEVFVIDDGGTDRSLEIARSYEAKYPSTFIPVHKRNGGWGSTMNYSIQHASGKYFKVLDGDDWFRQDKLVDLISNLKNTNADVVATNGFVGPDERSMICKDMFCYMEGQTVKFEDVMNDMEVLPTWKLCYKTSILKEINFSYPEHMFYTDMYYILMPFSKVRTIMFLDLPVYCYRLEREGNTMSISSRLKHQDELIKVCKGIVSYCAYEEHQGNSNKPYLVRRVSETYAVIIRTLLYNRVCKETKKLIQTLDEEVYSLSFDIYKEVESIGRIGKFIFLMRITNFRAYWLMQILKYMI